jgi:hypothetical protein
MSRYTVNKLMRQVLLDDDTLAAYRDEPERYVRAQPGLTAVEAAALSTTDYGALYALGAHPYLLWSFAEAALVPPMSRPDLVEAFRVAAASAAGPDGHAPDFATTRLEVTT